MEKGRSSDKKNEYRKIAVLFLRFSGWVVWPVLLAVLIGSWLDDLYDTSPWILLASVGVSFFVSMAGLVKETLKEYKSIESSLSDERKNSENDDEDLKKE